MCENCERVESGDVDVDEMWTVCVYPVLADPDLDRFPVIDYDAQPFTPPTALFGTSFTAFMMARLHAELNGHTFHVDHDISTTESMVGYSVAHDHTAPVDAPNGGFSRAQVILVHQKKTTTTSVLDRIRLYEHEQQFS